MTGSRIPLIIPLLLLAAAAPEAPSTATGFKAPPVAAPTAPSAPTVPNVPPVTVPNAPQATQVPAAPQATTEPKLPPTVSLQKIAPEEAMPILGQIVVGPDGKDIARLVDMLVDGNGQPVAAVLDFGGFMGVGSRKIAVHWSALHFEPAKATHRIILSLTADEIKAAPELKDPEKPAPVVVPATSEPQSAPE
jgi:hypothetical protein